MPPAKAVYKFVVLDDDPTGVQCIHDLPVYTDWSVDTLAAALQQDYPLFFILTNSRAITAGQTIAMHREIALNLLAASARTQCPFQLISRGDSTLRGHYPLEIDVLRDTIEANSAIRYAGEIICPAFFEGGRLTRDDTHFAWINGQLIPVGETEFARDRTFQYHSSNLRDYIQEKCGRAIDPASILSISLAMLRAGDESAIRAVLEQANGRRIIVNSESYQDLDVFTQVLRQVLDAGKSFICRAAASFIRSVINQPAVPLLKREQLLPAGAPGRTPAGGLIIVGSHTQKTSAQLEALLAHREIAAAEFQVDAVFDEQARSAQHLELVRAAGASLAAGRSFLIYTQRQLRFSPDAEESLKISVAISDALAAVVCDIAARPAFIIVKGGITSYDIAIKGLGVRQAMAAGQVFPSVPAWILSEGSKFPGVPYIICPGNTGSASLLSDIFTMLAG